MEDEYNVHIEALLEDSKAKIVDKDQKKAHKKTRSEISRRNKKVGNREENKIAKTLGEWIFNDKFTLKKHDTSGARKEVYSGDIVVQKPIRWPIFFLNIEVKNGYADNYPDFWNHTMLLKWMKKCIKESDDSKEQKLILLITQFKNRQKLVTTNYLVKSLPFKASFPIEWETRSFAFVYLLKDLMKHEFEDLFDVKGILKKLGYDYEYNHK